MHSPPLLFFLVHTLAFLTGAKPSLGFYKVHESRTHVPVGWNLTRRHDATSTISLRFALKQKNIENIGSLLHDVSHPKSANYGKHWTPSNIVRMFAPRNESVDTVRGWLIAGGIGEERITLGRTKGWIQVDTTVREAEQLMITEYNVYTHVSGKEHVACEVYHLPEHVQLHVDFVTPSVHFDAKLTHHEEPATPDDNGKQGVGITLESTHMVSRTIGDLEHCDKYITPACLRTLYGLSYEPVATNKNSYGIVEYTPQAYLQRDLQMFAQNYSTDLVGKKPDFVSIDGGFIQTDDQGLDYNAVSNVDVQYGMTLVTGAQTVTLYQTGDMLRGASFNNFLDAIDGSYCTFKGGDDIFQDGSYPDPLHGGYNGPEACGTVKPTYVISTSYSHTEADLTPFYTSRQCSEYAKLGLMGITVLYSSGNYGVAGNFGLCRSVDGPMSGNVFNPTFPASCPYVTSVGATMVKPNTTVFEPEMACMGETYSGGGFSNHFAMPKYQKDAVNFYLNHHHPHYPSNIWNSTGTSRAYPDISANGANYIAAINGKFQLVGGTSCSTPVTGAIFTMINDARLAIGKGPIGFINPTIYCPEFADAFNDITEGSNPGCGTLGYNATKGWDPVTGLGTPNFPKLLALWLSLP